MIDESMLSLTKEVMGFVALMFFMLLTLLVTKAEIEASARMFILDELSAHFQKRVYRFEKIKFGSHRFVNIHFDEERYLPDMVQLTQKEFRDIILEESK